MDIHSHLLPGIDDGVKTIKEAQEVIQCLASLGYTKLITTPHIIMGQYENTPSIILARLQELQHHLSQSGISTELLAAAEYYFDEYFVALVQQRDRNQLMLIADKYLLFETPFFTQPQPLHETVFTLRSMGIVPILAHPERYIYLQEQPKRVQPLLDMGVLFQVNINSLSGRYSRAVRKLARHIIRFGKAHFLGSDCHGMHHALLLAKSRKSRHYALACNPTLMNHSLL